MSYCRWSSDNFNCDLYCYESSDGFITHVAGRRWRAWFRLFHFLTDKRIQVHDEFSIRITRWNLINFPTRITHKAIRSRHAGKSFTDSTEEEMFDRIQALSREGFQIPKTLLAEVNRQ